MTLDHPPKIKILILEEDDDFREFLKEVCSQVGEVTATDGIRKAFSHLTLETFDLVMIDWQLIREYEDSLFSTLGNFQPGSRCIALFTEPDLANVIAAMKSGARDILWTGLKKDMIIRRIKDCLSRRNSQTHFHSFVSRLADFLVEKAIHQNSSLFKARREFSRTFIQQVLQQQNMRRSQLASFMNISPRTLHRHLSV